MKEYEIWMEGYAATGEHGTASKIGEFLAEDFDDAVLQYNEHLKTETEYKPTFAEPYTRRDFISQEAFLRRRSNWKIWGCALFDNEADARKSFG